MKYFAMVFCVLVAGAAMAGERFTYSLGDHDLLYGGNPQFSKTVVDTQYLIGPWGSGAQVNGQFQDPGGNPDWNGWTHYDVTQEVNSHWQISDYHADNLPGGAGNLAAWCGDINLHSCNADDPEGGYGNSWDEQIEWRGLVADPTSGVDVRFTANANIDSEPGYDYSHIRYLNRDGEMDAASFDGFHPNQLIDVQFSLEPEDYQGEGADEVVVRAAFTSDGGWSDKDCLYTTAGAIQIDDITVTLDQGTGPVTSFTDFEEGWGDWGVIFPPGVGDFAQLWTNLNDLDPCVSNPSPQVAFIDDGVVVPGTGGMPCIDWCYGPSGYIVNNNGGLAGPDHYLNNAVLSPVIPWPGPQYSGCLIEWDYYRHEGLWSDSPGIGDLWLVRSTASLDPADIEAASWQDRDSGVRSGGPGYGRSKGGVTDLLEPDRRFIQLRLGAWEWGWHWGWEGANGTPAPYFDNVRIIAYPFFGPAMATREIDIANDNFPASGVLDLVNLGNNSVRFDMANTSIYPSHLVNIPGDSVVVDIVPVRDGAEFVGNPELHWRLKKNLIFDPWRTSVYGAATTGVSVGAEAQNAGGVVPGKWAFDLPDSNFLFPGDVLHYFIAATDDDGSAVQTAFMPPDTTGFSDFSRALSYHSSYTVRALPSVFEDPENPGVLTTPKVLFWNDFGNRGGENEWHGAFANLGLVLGRDYDCYYTNGPSSGVGNGLGGRATEYSLVGYEDLIYTSGDLAVNTISNGDFDRDPRNDLAVLDAWLQFGGKDMFLTGDNLVLDLAVNAGSDGNQFLDDWLKVGLVNSDLRHLISNQSTPLVRAVPGNGIFADDASWIAYGGCDRMNTFDAVVASTEAGAIRVAEFTDPSGAGGQYSYSAATYYHNPTYDSRVISLPYDFTFIYNAPGTGGGLPARTVVLENVLGFFGVEGDPQEVTPVPQTVPFAVHSYPNPFNPQVKLEYTVPKAGHLSLKVFDVRGQLVRTLLDERVETGGNVMWDGTDDLGAASASGVYFTEARSAGQTRVAKLTLIR